MFQNKEIIIDQIEKARKEMHKIIDQRFDNILLRLNAEDFNITDGSSVCVHRTLPLCLHPSIFKGQKPVSITFADGRTVEVPTWKKAVTEIMKECNADPVMHERLMDIRGKVMGKQRTILSASPDGMDVPLKIDDELYLEAKYDTETLLYVTTDRILRAIGFNYSDISVTIKYPKLKCLPQELEEPVPEEDIGISMQM